MKHQKLKLARGSPLILSCISAVGVIGTAVLSARCTKRAMQESDSEQSQKHWKYYIPTIISGGATIVCIFGIDVLSKKQSSAIAGAYIMMRNAYQDYQNKVKDIYGEEVHQDIINSIAAEKARETHLYSQGILGGASLSFSETDPEDLRLFYDSFSERYFESTIDRVLQAEYHLNRNYALGGGVPLNMYYEFLGIEPINGGDTIGWSMMDELYWIDFDHHKTVLDDGLEVYVVDMVWLPSPQDTDEY